MLAMTNRLVVIARSEATKQTLIFLAEEETVTPAYGRLTSIGIGFLWVICLLFILKPLDYD